MQWTGGLCVLRRSPSFSFRRLPDPFPLLPAGLWPPALLPGSVPGAVHGAGLLPCLGGVSALQRYCYTADPVNVSTSFKRVNRCFGPLGQPRILHFGILLKLGSLLSTETKRKPYLCIS